jgi:hypothetical protein
MHLTITGLDHFPFIMFAKSGDHYKCEFPLALPFQDSSVNSLYLEAYRLVFARPSEERFKPRYFKMMELFAFRVPRMRRGQDVLAKISELNASVHHQGTELVAALLERLKSPS